MGAILDRAIGAAARGPSPADGARPLFRRPQARRSAPCRDRALAACPCRHQRHRHARGAADAGRACGADRQGLRGRRPRHDAVDGALQEARRRPDVSAASAGDRDRPRAACRLSGRGRGRRYARAGPRRRRARRGRLCAAARRGVGARGVRAGRAAALRRLPEQRGLFLPGRRQGRDRRRLRQRRARRRAAPGHQPRHRQHARAARRHRRIRSRHRPLHAALRLPAAVAVPQRHRRDHDEDSGGRAPADHRRHRRLLRPARLDLSGNHPDAVGGAPRRPAGEMDLRPATKRTSATTTPATTSSMRRWRSTRTASSSACASAASAISAPSCRFAARCRRWSTSARCAASTPRRRCMWRSPAC